MKQQIKSLIASFLGELNESELKIPSWQLSQYYAVILACFILRKGNPNSNLPLIQHEDFDNAYIDELHLVSKRYKDIYDSYLKIKKSVRKHLQASLFNRTQRIIVVSNDSDEFDEILSWSYQFFKKNLERDVFKRIGSNQNKIENIGVLHATQFFTDKYMVRYLVEESLSKVKSNSIDDVVVIDCAAGGGNFLIYSFEKLFEKYCEEHPQRTKQDIVDDILSNSLVGYDLDNKLARIASLSIFLKASKHAVPSVEINVFEGISNDKLGFFNSEIISNQINGLTFYDKIHQVKKANRIKLYLTNPPFMGKRDMDKELKDFLQTQFPKAKADACSSFIQRTLDLMDEQDILGVVSQNSWMYLSSFKEFRADFLKNYVLNTCIDLGSSAFEDINGEKANVALCLISKFGKSRFVNLKYKSYDEKRQLLESRKSLKAYSYSTDQRRFLENEHFEFNYQIDQKFSKVLSLPQYGQFGKPMQGTSTGNNAEFVKYAWEVNGSLDWKLVSKGGGYSKWAGLNYFKVYWGKNAETIKANKGSALRNIEKIPFTQLVYSDTGTLGLNVRILKENQVFIASGPGIQVKYGDKYAHLAFLNSRIATFLLKALNPKFSISAGYISRIPVVQNILKSQYIISRSKKCLEIKERYLASKLPNFEFQHYRYADISNVENYIEECIINDILNDLEKLKLEFEIEKKIIEEYDFSELERNEIYNVVGKSSFYNRNHGVVEIVELDRMYSTSIDVNCLFNSKRINGFPVGTESLLEDICYKLSTHPKAIADFIVKNVSKFEQTKQKYLRDLLHKVILFELGVKHISIYKYKSVDFKKWINNISKKHSFLKLFSNLELEIGEILKGHHNQSFFNKPLISLSDKQIIVGQFHE